MAIGEKFFEETGKVTGMNIKSVHPVEGVKMEVSFASEIREQAGCQAATT